MTFLSWGIFAFFIKLTIDTFTERERLQQDTWELYTRMTETIHDSQEVQYLFHDLMEAIKAWNKIKWWKNRRFRKKLEEINDQYDQAIKALHRKESLLSLFDP